MAELSEKTNRFYGRSMKLLDEGGVPFLLGGAYAFCVYTGIARHTKDVDFFVREKDFESALQVFRQAGYRAEVPHPHWLGKAFQEGASIDIIYRAGNGLSPVDELWFERAVPKLVFGRKALLSPPEEMIAMKAFIMERERFDGADVAHLLFHCAEQMDWNHLLQRFGPDWPVLLSHLILFGYIFPAAKERIPSAVLEELLARLRSDEKAREPLCRGTLLSRAQYLVDVREGGLRDARLEPRVGINPAQIEAWSEAAEDHVKPHHAESGD